MTRESGLSFRHQQGRVLRYLPQVTGSGVALIDFDGDGELDAFYVQGSGPEETKDPRGMPPCALFRRLDGKYSECAGLAGVADRGYGMAPVAADFDNDGYPDLAITHYMQPTTFYRNNGDGTFTEVSDPAGLSDPKLLWPSSLTAFDYDRDGFLDLYLGQYVNFGPNDWVPNPQIKDEGWEPGPVTLLPGRYKGLPNKLYHNDANGRFSDRTREAGPVDGFGQSLGALAADFDGDGWQDLMIANDAATPNVVYRNLGNGRFQDVSKGSWADEARGSMGFAVGDVDLDGLPDVLVSHWHNPLALYRSVKPGGTQGRIRFLDRALNQGLIAEDALVGWAVAFLDVDNDGFEDILLLHGHTSPPGDDPLGGKMAQQLTYFYKNRGDGFFERQAPAGPSDPLSRKRVGRSAAFGDLDRDGTVDLVLSSNNEPAEVWQNAGAKGAWIGLWLTGTGCNRNAVGAHVDVTAGTMRRWKELVAGDSYFATNARHLLFGLGEESVPASVHVRWPSGRVEDFGPLESRRYHRLVEGTGRAP